MDFQRVVIVGPGLIGGSIELAFRQRVPHVEILTVDRDDNISECAADLIVLAAPITGNIQRLSDVRSIAGCRALITDTGSTKASIVDAAAGLRFIGGHPIAGAAAAGRDAARADLFAGRPWILTPDASADPADVSRLRELIEAIGATVIVLDPGEHDRLFAYLSHLPQLAVSTLMDVIGRHAGAEGLRLAGTGLRDSTRLAASPAGIWTEIVGTNRANVVAALDAFITRLVELRNDADGRTLQTTFDAAARWKSAMERSDRETS